MENEKYRFENPGLYVIKHSKALDDVPPVKLQITGTIEAPLEYCQKRKELIDCNEAVLLYSTDERFIILKLQPENKYGGEISGKAQLHPDLEKWGINEGVEYNIFELADKIKLNRHKFTSIEVAMKLVTELKNFKAKVEKEIELSTNNRGNQRQFVDQVFKGNIPEKFSLNLHVFKNEPVKKIDVEIYINPNTYSCSLVSPDLEALIENESEKMIIEVISNIKELLPDLPVFSY